MHTSEPSDPEFRAFKGGLSMFGVITWLLLQLTPPTNAELTTVVQSDKDMMHDLTRLLKVSPAQTVSPVSHWHLLGKPLANFICGVLHSAVRHCCYASPIQQ